MQVKIPLENICTCSKCAKQYDAMEYKHSSSIVQLMKEHHVCYQCAYWIKELTNTNRPLEVINGNLYVFNHPMQRPANKIIGGSLGKEIYIMKNDMQVLKSNNVYCRGKIPDAFIQDYPDTAIFIDIMTYQKLRESTHKCIAKGCWDRYKCLRYDMSCEKDGQFNVIPPTHKTGNERCTSFINKDTYNIKNIQYDY